MTTPENYQEEECLNIYWEIKNFNYSWKTFNSPAFFFRSTWCNLSLESTSNAIKSRFVPNFGNICQISFLTCDGSTEESKSGNMGYFLEVSKDIIFGNRRNAFLPEGTLTVRCRILNEQHKGEKVFLRSEIEVRRRCFLWTLENFTKGRHENITVENSDRYGDIKVSLSLKPADGDNIDEQFYSQVSRSGGEACSCVLKVSLQGPDGKDVECGSGETVFQKQKGQQSWAFTSLIKNSKLLTLKDLFPETNAISLKCEFALTPGEVLVKDSVDYFYADVSAFSKESGDRSIDRKEANCSDSISDLQTDLKNILDEGTLCDASLQVGSDVIPVHKSILSARSPVFKKMFATQMKEAINNAVAISDLDVDTTRRLLLYMYTNTIHDYAWENTAKLFVAGDKYQVLSLKQKCSSFLEANISTSNASEVLVLADLHQDARLKTAVCRFISKEDFEVFTTEAWKQLEKNNPSLAYQALREVCSKKLYDSLKN